MSRDAVDSHGEPWKAGQQSWNSTVTNLSKSPRVTMICIEVLVSLVAGVLLLLAIFGSQRRRSRNWFLQKGVFVAYTLSFSLPTYALGFMQSSAVKSSMYPIWAISLFMLHACTDSITTYSLDENRRVTGLRAYQALMCYSYTALLLITMQPDYDNLLILMAAIAFLRSAQRLAVFSLAGYSWNFNKIVADYMYQEQKNDEFATMEGCNYLVDWPISKSKFDASTYAITLEDLNEVIDIGKIWRCKDESLAPRKKKKDESLVPRKKEKKDESLVLELKDACLSFSLFHLLRRRFFEFACDESKDRAHNFVLEVLLSEYKLDGATDYNRVFKVIEVELAFMYDFFFTKYAVIYYGSVAATVWSLISYIGISITVYITVRAPVKITQNNSPIKSTATDDIVIALVILAFTALLESLQLLLYWTSIWGRVSFVCQSVREQAGLNRRASQGRETMTRGRGLKGSLAKIGACLAYCVVRLKGFLASCPLKKQYWRHKLGQYSLLDSVSYYNSNPSLLSFEYIFHIPMMVKTFIVIYLFDVAFIHPKNYQAYKVRNKAGKSVELPGDVKKAVICSLKRTGGTLSNGKSFLESNGAKHLSWACTWVMHPEDPRGSQRNQNQTHIILTWHIATWYCEMLTLSPDGPEELKVHRSIATKLSKYCAYLVVSAPELLPGHHYDTVRKFDAAAVEAITFLQKSTSMYEAMKRYWKPQTLPQETKTIFESGVKLGNQLEEMEEVARWQVMADFWAEMMLYLAPSDNVKDHIEQLARGGEFITHLWALLSHAGILKRDQEHQAGGV